MTDLKNKKIITRKLRVCGLVQSELEELIQDFLKSNDPILTVIKKTGEIHIKLQTENDAQNKLQKLNDMEKALRKRLGVFVYGEGEESLEEVCGKDLIKRNYIISVAESCTGGYLAHRLTNVPGSSRYFKAGIVAYDNRWKREFLGVDGKLIEEYGAVSSEVARAMSEGIRRRTGADIGLGITGIAGPGGGSPLKPVGLVFIGLDIRGKFQEVIEERFEGGRLQIKEQAAAYALFLLHRSLVINE